MAITAARDRGNYYEDLALEYLLDQGLVLLERNYLCKLGELDLIMRDKACLVVVEVRYRKNNRYGSAAESISDSKQKKIIAATKHYVGKMKIQSSVRFDVIAITGTAPLQWVQHAFLTAG